MKYKPTTRSIYGASCIPAPTVDMKFLAREFLSGSPAPARPTLLATSVGHVLTNGTKRNESQKSSCTSKMSLRRAMVGCMGILFTKRVNTRPRFASHTARLRGTVGHFLSGTSFSYGLERSVGVQTLLLVTRITQALSHGLAAALGIFTVTRRGSKWFEFLSAVPLLVMSRAQTPTGCRSVATRKGARFFFAPGSYGLERSVGMSALLLVASTAQARYNGIPVTMRHFADFHYINPVTK